LIGKKISVTKKPEDSDKKREDESGEEHGGK
jgi:hypothetical protein